MILILTKLENIVWLNEELQNIVYSENIFFFAEISTCSCNSLPAIIICNLLLSWDILVDYTSMVIKHDLSFICRYDQKIILSEDLSDTFMIFSSKFKLFKKYQVYVLNMS